MSIKLSFGGEYMKVIIAGGREFCNYNLLCSEIEKFKEENRVQGIEVVCGKARGADQLGEKYALSNSLPIKYFPADWGGNGKAAGYIRNVEMAEYADALVAFWNGKSKGTKHMIEIAKRKNLIVTVVRY